MDQNIQNPTPNVLPENNSQTPKSRTNYILIGLVFILILLLGVVLSFFLGRQSAETQKTDSTAPTAQDNKDQNTDESSTVDDCKANFESKNLKLSFEYNDCEWKINEELITPEQGVYSTITATHTSGKELLVSSITIGMGGGYPSCINSSDIDFVNEEIVRISSTENGSRYYYLNPNTDFGVKGYPGEYGDEKFTSYFTFLNPAEFPNANVCWRGSGTNPVEIVNPKPGQEGTFLSKKDINITIEEGIISNSDFMTAADTLAVEIYSKL